MLVDFRDELSGAGESDRGDEDDAVVHPSILLDRLPEWAALVVDCECRDLLDQLQEVDGRVEQRRLELAFEVDFGLFRLGALDVLRDVDERRDVDCELPEDGADDVRVENIGLRPFFRQCFNGLGMLARYTTRTTNTTYLCSRQRKKTD